MRANKDSYYCNIAVAVAERSTCLRRKYGAVIVKNDVIVSTGYNGAPRGRANCCDIRTCKRDSENIPHGERYELCRSVHAEQNAIIAAGYEKTNGATLYLAGIDVSEVDGAFDEEKFVEDPDCCMMCKRVIINAGIKKVVFLSPKSGLEILRTVDVQEWIDKEDE